MSINRRKCLIASLGVMSCSVYGREAAAQDTQWFDTRLLVPPGYSQEGNFVSLGSLRPPATDARLILYRSLKTDASGKRESRQLQIFLCAAASADDAWTTLRSPANSPFGAQEPLKGLILGPDIEGAEHVSHAPLFPSGMYSIAGTRKNFGVAVTHICGQDLFRLPPPDQQVALAEALLRQLLTWSAQDWQARRMPKLTLYKTPSALDLKTDKGETLQGLQFSGEAFVSVATLAELGPQPFKTDLVAETCVLEARRLALKANTPEYRLGDMNLGLKRAPRWWRSQLWISQDDAATLFNRRFTRR
jgi:hypothetical protein